MTTTVVDTTISKTSSAMHEDLYAREQLVQLYPPHPFAKGQTQQWILTSLDPPWFLCITQV